MSLELTILGFNSAVPTAFTHPTAQLLNIAERYFLIDCGEGTQVQLRKAKAKFNRINHIFISHLHGDHVFGLIGLISTLQLLGRDTPLYIHGPKGIEEFIMIQLKLTESKCTYDIVFNELSSKKSVLVFEDDKVEVFSIPLNHRVYTNGYLFKEKKKLRKLNMDAIQQYGEIDICDYQNLKNGKDYVMEDGTIIDNEDLTVEGPRALSYAYCSDTRYKPDIIPLIKGVDLLYHESTFLHEAKELATYTGHSTAKEAGIIAREAGVKKLVLGHFSNRYHDYSVLLNEAKLEFENTVLPRLIGTIKIKE
ncbi:ribonuclease Z [Faecalibacter rhinopitheci]|uniref:Ribonuclease Z n=1 Tax=Faecalibacter rhinopitheci TaxID=2779678 RepID=A0A8J7G563_9FLAO|nr:ribonuclease Z [Faecalibacter rhinopitheci]MBF0596450.1 ribonuclease Z [Faecalibacter rhinopitheci]